MSLLMASETAIPIVKQLERDHDPINGIINGYFKMSTRHSLSRPIKSVGGRRVANQNKQHLTTESTDE